MLTELLLTKTIKRFVKAWEIAPQKINEGFCGSFAAMVIENVGGETDDFYESFTKGLIGHVWITYKNKHYDAECPEGVDFPEELLFFKRIYEKSD